MVQIFEIREEVLNVTEELNGLLPRLPQWRLRKAQTYRREIDRFLCAKSFLMLEEMLRENFGLHSCPEFSYGINGKPHFRDYPDICFNISHCHKGIACAVTDRPVGIDIEEIQYDDTLAKFILHPDELAAVRCSDAPDIRFTEYWTRKESFLKLTGEGLRDDMKHILTEEGLMDNGHVAIPKVEEVEFMTSVNRPVGYVCSIAIPASH